VRTNQEQIFSDDRWQANSTKRPQSPQTDTLGGLECLVFTGGIGEHSTLDWRKKLQTAG
jgi:acetate kinase